MVIEKRRWIDLAWLDPRLGLQSAARGELAKGKPTDTRESHQRAPGVTVIPERAVALDLGRVVTEFYS
jgi:hypothetical protein